VVAVSVSVTVTQANEDGSEARAHGELAAALAVTAEQFSVMLAWAAADVGELDHGEREKAIGESGRELQRLRWRTSCTPTSMTRFPALGHACRCYGR
jgi:hypothetical protein